MEVTIYRYDELHQISSLFNSNKKVKLNLSFLTTEENDLFSRDLNTQLNACGCETGKYFFAYTLFLSIICYFLKLPLFNNASWSIIPITVLSAVIGKLVGLFIARIRVFKIIRKIRQHNNFCLS